MLMSSKFRSKLPSFLSSSSTHRDPSLQAANTTIQRLQTELDFLRVQHRQSRYIADALTGIVDKFKSKKATWKQHIINLHYEKAALQEQNENLKALKRVSDRYTFYLRDKNSLLDQEILNLKLRNSALHREMLEMRARLYEAESLMHIQHWHFEESGPAENDTKR